MIKAVRIQISSKGRSKTFKSGRLRWIWGLVSVATILIASCMMPSLRREIQSDGIDCPEPSVGSLDSDKLLWIVRHKGCGVRTISDVLDHLPYKFRSSYTLFYRSRSIQGPQVTDFINPRAILFTDPADALWHPRKLSLSFNNDIHQMGHNSLEVLQIDEEATTIDKIFQFFEIKFPLHESEVGDADWSDIQKKITVSPINPQRCVLCHGQPARPIFPGYPDWEGSFDSIGHGTVPGVEVEGMSQYLAALNNRGPNRYQKLAPPTALGVSFTNPNEFLNGILGNSNGNRVARIILETPNYAKFRFAFAATFAECENIAGFIPGPLLNDLLNNVESRFHLKARWTDAAIHRLDVDFFNHDRVFILNGADFRLHYPKYYKEHPLYALLYADTINLQGFDRADPTPVGARLLMEGRGFEIDNWFLDLTQPTYRFQDGGGATYAVTHILIENDPEFPDSIRSLVRKTPKFNLDPIQTQLCGALRPLSLMALKGVRIPRVQPPPPIDLNSYPVTFVQTCAKCHDSDTPDDPLAPDIPFLWEAKMSVWLTDKGNLGLLHRRIFSNDEGYKMPPTRFLSDEEKNNILAFLGKF